MVSVDTINEILKLNESLTILLIGRMRSKFVGKLTHVTKDRNCQIVESSFGKGLYKALSSYNLMNIFIQHTDDWIRIIPLATNRIYVIVSNKNDLNYSSATINSFSRVMDLIKTTYSI